MLRLREVAHRGWSATAPENTAKAFRLALSGFADAIECDLQLTKDGRVIVLHDTERGRTCAGYGFVGELTYDELLALDFGEGEKIMLLDELLELVNARKFLFLEIKNPGNIYPGINEKILRALADYPRESFMLESFNHGTIREIEDTSIQKGIICYDEADFLVEQCMHARCDWISIYWMSINKELFRKLREHGIKLSLWTVDEKFQLDWIKRRLEGCDGDIFIATDKPGTISKEAVQ